MKIIKRIKTSTRKAASYNLLCNAVLFMLSLAQIFHDPHRLFTMGLCFKIKSSKYIYEIYKYLWNVCVKNCRFGVNRNIDLHRTGQQISVMVNLFCIILLHLSSSRGDWKNRNFKDLSAILLDEAAESFACGNILRSRWLTMTLWCAERFQTML